MNLLRIVLSIEDSFLKVTTNNEHDAKSLNHLDTSARSDSFFLSHWCYSLPLLTCTTDCFEPKVENQLLCPLIVQHPVCLVNFVCKSLPLSSICL